MRKVIGLHEMLLGKVARLPSDFEPYGTRSRDGEGPCCDCSCGCVFFATLEGWPVGDWGVCVNPCSPRFALLTFEHQGCPKFLAGKWQEEVER